MDPVLSEANTRIQNAIEHLKRELATIRAGRANPSLIENVLVNAYGTKMKLMEVATIASPQPTLLTVQVWDVGLTPDILKSLQEANLGLNPASDGQLIRLPIPPLTEERRLEFVKMAHQKMEQTRIEIRQIRQDVRADWEKQQESSEFGEDELERRFNLLQTLIERSTAQVDEIGKQKEEELTSI
jgi:ribosome recycling factor